MSININKHAEFCNPKEIKDEIHIVGVGAIGSHVAEQLARLGFPKLYLHDTDTVTSHNIANQMFTSYDIGRMKTAAVAEMCEKINPSIELKISERIVTETTMLRGHVFLCVDSIETRKKIAEANLFNPNILSMYDFRMRLIDAQHYAVDWKKEKDKKSFIESMNFTSAEAKEETPINACGSALSIIPTVKIITAVGISNFVNFLFDNKIKKLILIDAFNYQIDAF